MVIKYRLLDGIILHIYNSTENVNGSKGVFSIIRLFSFWYIFPRERRCFFFRPGFILNINACLGVLLTEVNFA